ncbi:MAG: autotransporter-associated beta strand repeat-containing protein [Verrucomicrobia bacterium]|nr:autotransporter-associated beta strand repeat-containing protein [Verrucomicrobiota bacterium]
MKNNLQFTIRSRGLVTCLAVLASCQPLLAGGQGPSFDFNYPTDNVWADSSVADMYFFAPTSVSPDPAMPLVYFTTTCRSTHGCEAALMYANGGTGGFGVFDWSVYYEGGGGWQTVVNLAQPAAAPYLTDRPDEFGITRQMLHVRNGTYYLGVTGGVYNFLNKVDLFNFVRGDWDVFYSRNFSTTDEAAAHSWRGFSDAGGWCPMVETFETDTAHYTYVPNALGCDLARFFYDGKSTWQTPDNTHPVNMAPVGQTSGANWQTLNHAPNTHFAVCIGGTNQVGGAYPMGSLCVTTNTNAAGFTLSPSNGMISPHWVSTPDGQWWDKTAVGLAPGYYRITFNPVAGVSTPPEQILQLTANNVSTVQGVYGTNVANTPVVVLTNPLDQQTVWGTSISAEALVAAGTPPYTVRFYTSAAGGAYVPAGVASTEPYTVSLGALPIGTYRIYATVTDSSTPVSATATSATSTFMVSPTITWTNSAATGNWSNPLSWDSGAVPVSGATVIFGTGGSTSVVDTVSRHVSSILFTRAADFALSASGGAGLTINNGITVSNNFTNTISAPVTLGGANTWTVNDTGTLQASGTVGGNALLTKAGSGTLSLTGNNTFTGGVTLKAGTLLLGSGNALGPGPLTIDRGYINGTSGSLAMPHNNPVVLNGTFTWTGGGGINWDMGTGAVTLNTDILIYVGNTLTIGGVISGPGGRNALDIAFKNMVGATYGVQVLAPIPLRGNQTITGSGAAINGAIRDNGHGYGLTVAVADVWGGWGGTVALNAANTYSGDTTVNTGTLALGHNLALQYSALNTATNIARLSVSSPTIGGLKGSTALASVFTAGYGSVSALTLNPQSGTCTYAGAIANGASGMTLTKSGNGTQVLSGPITYTGATNVNAGTLVLDGANTGGGGITVKAGARLGGNSSTLSAVTVQSGGKLLANVADWDAGTGSNLTVTTLSLPATWTLDVTATGLTETDKTFSFLTTTGGINGFTAQTVNGPGAGTWLVRKSSSDAKVLELVYTASHGSPTTLELASSLNPADTGESVTFTATVKAGGVTATGATGTCVFKVDGTVMATVPMAGGTASYSRSFTFGPHSIVATYSGDAGYAFSSASLTQICGNLIVPTYTTRGDGKTVATFTNGSGLWVIPAGVTHVEVLVVGGGGGAWNNNFQSGSGAGGMYFGASYAVTPGPIGITVGAGATDGTGASSLFGVQLISYGGTKGNGYTNGGDQGGYSVDGGTTIVPGNLGYHYSPMDGNWCSGGGAGHAGYKGDVQLGGAGAACSITGSTVYYAGGGGAPSSYSSSGGTGYNVGGGGSGPAAFGGRAISGLATTGGGGGGGWGGGGGAGGSGIVIVAYLAPSPYDLWKAGPFAKAFSDTDPAHDPDHDGRTNQQEFAFGLDPTSGASSSPIAVPPDKTTHKFRYTRWAASGLTYTVETSTTLQSWAGPADATQTVVSASGGVETVEVELTSPPSGDRVFVRVKAQ